MFESEKEVSGNVTIGTVALIVEATLSNRTLPRTCPAETAQGGPFSGASHFSTCCSAAYPTHDRCESIVIPASGMVGILPGIIVEKRMLLSKYYAIYNEMSKMVLL